MLAMIVLMRFFARGISSETDFRERSGLRSKPRQPFARGIWSILVSLWLAVVLALFLEIRVLNSASVTHLLQELVAH